MSKLQIRFCSVYDFISSTLFTFYCSPANPLSTHSHPKPWVQQTATTRRRCQWSAFRLHNHTMLQKNNAEQRLTAMNQVLPSQPKATDTERSSDKTLSINSLDCDIDEASCHSRETMSESSDSKKSVRWNDVALHMHVMELGDNPSVSSGLPVQIGWEQVAFETVTIEEFEARRQDLRRTKDDLKLKDNFRASIVKKSGLHRMDIIRCGLEIQKIKEERSMSAKEGAWRKKLWIFPLIFFRNRKKVSSFKALHADQL